MNEKQKMAEIAPVYDCGSCFYPQLAVEDMQRVLSDYAKRAKGKDSGLQHGTAVDIGATESVMTRGGGWCEGDLEIGLPRASGAVYDFIVRRLQRNMALSMKDRNDKEAWAAYEKEGKKLMEEVMERRKAIEEKYKDSKTPLYGLDGAPDEKELGEVTKWYMQELIKLRQKYGIQ